MRDKNAAEVQPTGDPVCILAGKNGRKKAAGAFVNKRSEPVAAADGPPHFGSHSIKASGGGPPQSRSFSCKKNLDNRIAPSSNRAVISQAAR